VQYYAGGTAAVGNVIPQQMNRSLFEAMDEYAPDKRTFIMSRSGFSGIQKYGASVWSGDVQCTFDALRVQVRTAANMGFSGIPYWNSMSAVSRGHRRRSCTCAGASSRCSIRSLSPARLLPPRAVVVRRLVEAEVRDLLHLRYRLIPYLYTVAREAYDTGAPMMRPLVLEWPDDPAVRDIASQYLYGDSLMIRPVVVPGASSVDVYFPEGTWYNAFTDERFDGPLSTNMAVTSPTIPLFVRAPAIIPMAPYMDTSDARPLDSIELLVYPPNPGGTPGAGSLYEDDGLTNGYQRGECAWTHFDVRQTSNTSLIVTISPTQVLFPGQVEMRSYQITVHAAAEPPAVWHNGQALERRADQAGFDAASSGWFYDEDRHVLTAKAPPTHVSQAQRFTTLPNEDGSKFVTY
jgi:alpha-glucosidase (family GH31 glycosyl hydrolase)